jgi:hypothetical protein
MHGVIYLQKATKQNKTKQNIHNPLKKCLSWSWQASASIKIIMYVCMYVCMVVHSLNEQTQTQPKSLTTTN